MRGFIIVIGLLMQVFLCIAQFENGITFDGQSHNEGDHTQNFNNNNPLFSNIPLLNSITPNISSSSFNFSSIKNSLSDLINSISNTNPSPRLENTFQEPQLPENIAVNESDVQTKFGTGIVDLSSIFGGDVTLIGGSFTGGTSALPFPTAIPGNCGCYSFSVCQSNGVNGGIDVRIVTPNQCSSGTVYCCLSTTIPTSTFRTTTSSFTTCGLRSYIPNNLPYSGGQSEYGKYPWEAVILTNTNQYVGGAVLVSNRYVLTAAHKIYPYLNNFTTLKVRLGEWNALNNVEPYPVQDYGISSTIIHPSFNSVNLHYDIAVLQLNRNVDLTSSPAIRTACLPSNEFTTYVGETCWVAGWGKDAFTSGSYQPIQKEIELPIIASSTCQNLLRATRLGSSFNLDSTFICAGGRQMADACTGDGGSPLVCLSSTNQWTVVGLVAWGIGCGQANVPGVYVNVANLLPWIRQYIS